MEDDAVVRAVELLKAAGARFAYLLGSHASGEARPDSDIDIAAWFGRSDVDSISAGRGLPPRVDLLILDSAPLELVGRVASRGVLLFEEDPKERVLWESTTRKIFFDERPRVDQARPDFFDATRRRGRP